MPMFKVQYTVTTEPSEYNPYITVIANNVISTSKSKSKIKNYPKPTRCPYCGSGVVYTSNSAIYGKEYGNGKCYKCVNCDSYVGVHSGTDIPLGILADKELRQLKKQCHSLFDIYWNKSLNKSASHTRVQCYKQLASKLNILVDNCHFGWFNKEMLHNALCILKKGLFN